MIKSFLYIVIIISFIGSSCKSSGSAAESEPRKIPEDFSLMMKRTGCHGECPIYEVAVSADGTVLFQGEAFVEMKGRYTKTVDVETLGALISELKKADFWSLNEKYDNPQIMDLPSCTITCNMDGKSHTVLNRFDAPEKLDNLQTKIDEIIGKDGFQKVTK